jgi:transposase, IS6 family
MAGLVHAPLFRGRHFADEVITLAVHWYLRFSLSYRDVEELLRERGMAVDHTTVWHWVQRYAPELERRVRRHCAPIGRKWHLDETYIRAAGEWVYLYRAIDETGATVNFFLSRERSARAARFFLKRALERPERPVPLELVVDGNPTYPIAVRSLQREGKLPRETRWRCQKKSNNLLEQDHRAVQRRVKAKQNFQSVAGARCAIAGYEAIHMIRKGQVRTCLHADVTAQVCLVHQLLTQAA